MFLLNLLLGILKFIGIVFLVILGIILLVLCLLLFVPIRYNIYAGYKGEVKVTARITYLFKAIRVRFELTGKESLTDIRVLWFKLSGKEKKQHKSRQNAKPEKTKSSSVDTAIDEDKRQDLRTDTDNVLPQEVKETSEPAIQSEKEIRPEPQIQSGPDAIPEADANPEPDNHQTKDRKSKNKVPKSGKKDKKSKNVHTKDKTGGIMNNVKSVVAMVKENRAVLNFLFGQLKSLLRHILPGSHVINLRLGLDDPALLGELLGAVAVVRAATNLVINISPVWDEKAFDADCSFKGRILLGKVLFIALRVYFNKDVKKIIHMLKD